MINLEQIRQLQDKVQKAVAHLSDLQTENELLHEQLATYEKRIKEMETFIEEFRSEQREIEDGIVSALTHLDTLEQAVGGLQKAPAAVPAQASAKVGQPESVAESKSAAAAEAVAEAVDAADSVGENTIETADLESDAILETDEDQDTEEAAPGNRQLDIF